MLPNLGCIVFLAVLYTVSSQNAPAAAVCNAGDKTVSQCFDAKGASKKAADANRQQCLAACGGSAPAPSTNGTDPGSSQWQASIKCAMEAVKTCLANNPKIPHRDDNEQHHKGPKDHHNRHNQTDCERNCKNGSRDASKAAHADFETCLASVSDGCKQDFCAAVKSFKDCAKQGMQQCKNAGGNGQVSRTKRHKEVGVRKDAGNSTGSAGGHIGGHGGRDEHGGHRGRGGHGHGHGHDNFRDPFAAVCGGGQGGGNWRRNGDKGKDEAGDKSSGGADD